MKSLTDCPSIWTEIKDPKRRNHEAQVTLRFVDGAITGEGNDSFGHYTVRGTYDVGDGRTLFTKSYANVDEDYDGVWDGRRIVGWAFFGRQGTPWSGEAEFELRPDSSDP